jgi:hypothetical protein
MARIEQFSEEDCSDSYDRIADLDIEHEHCIAIANIALLSDSILSGLRSVPDAGKLALCCSLRG